MGDAALVVLGWTRSDLFLTHDVRRYVMLYIEQRLRNLVDPHVDGLADAVGNATKTESEMTGVLNYSITTLINKLHPRLRYWKLALIIGMLVTIILEFYRRRGVPYEEEKIAENGDVFF